MPSKLSSRLAAGCGAAAVVLIIVGNEVQKIDGGSPGLHEPQQVFVDTAGRPGTLLVGGYLIVVAMLLLVPFFVSLVARFRSDGENWEPLHLVTFGAALLTVAVGLMGVAPQLATGGLLSDGELTPELAKALYLMNVASFLLLWATSAIWIGATSALILRTRRFPRPFGWSGAVLAPALLVGSVAAFRFEGFALAWILTLLWILAASIVLTIRPAGRAPAPSGPDRLGDGAHVP